MDLSVHVLVGVALNKNQGENPTFVGCPCFKAHPSLEAISPDGQRAPPRSCGFGGPCAQKIAPQKLDNRLADEPIAMGGFLCHSLRLTKQEAYLFNMCSVCRAGQGKAVLSHRKAG